MCWTKTVYYIRTTKWKVIVQTGAYCISSEQRLLENLKLECVWIRCRSAAISLTLNEQNRTEPHDCFFSVSGDNI